MTSNVFSTTPGTLTQQVFWKENPDKNKGLKKHTCIPGGGGMSFDPVKYVKETLSRVEYACKMNFDPLAKRHIFSGYHITCLK